MTYEEAIAKYPEVVLYGCDPGPESCAFVELVLTLLKPNREERAFVRNAVYLDNKDIAEGALHDWFFNKPLVSALPRFLAYEKVGMQGKFCGESTFETATMGGEIRRAFRPHVCGTYAFRSSEWRHPLTGVGNAKTPLVYAECCSFFEPSGGGADRYKGTKAAPGPLWGLHSAGAGGNVEHLKDAMGVALGLTRVRFRSGKDPELYRRPW